MLTVPGDVGEKLEWAERYMNVLGQPVFIVTKSKTPYGLCDRCRPEVAGPKHDRRTCNHILCHGFHAATFDIERVAYMLALHRDGMLALRTGIGRVSASGTSHTIALDFEAAAHPRLGVTGIEVAEQWEAWGGGGTLVETLRQRTGSGGVHLLYWVNQRSTPLKYRGRFLPMTDLKAEDGYIAVGPEGDGRHWMNWDEAFGKPSLMDFDLEDYLRGVKSGPPERVGDDGVINASPMGYDFRECLRGRWVPDGVREAFIRDLSYTLRREGHSYDDITETMRDWWMYRIAQPPAARYYYPWEHVQYKIDRDWHNLDPNELNRLTEPLERWVEQVRDEEGKTVGSRAQSRHGPAKTVVASKARDWRER